MKTITFDVMAAHDADLSSAPQTPLSRHISYGYR